MDINLWQTLMLLVFSHFLFDFPLQNDYVAVHKNPFLNGINPIWVWPMTAHCVLHAVPVYMITGSFILTMLMFVSHYMIDFMKCWNKISYHTDQIAHLLVVVFIAFVSAGYLDGTPKAF